MTIASWGFARPALQSATFDETPPAHVVHSVAALKRTRLEFTARMIAAEALART